MSISEISISRYNPSYTMDYDKMILAPIPNYFSDLLAKQAELAKSGESQLTQQKIEELSGKCDMNQMSSQEYKDLINYLADKGVIDRPEPLGFDPGERIYIKGGQAWLEPAGTTRKQNFVNLSSQYFSSGKFSPSIADQTKELLELYQRLMESNLSASDDVQLYASYRQANDPALAELITTA